MSEQLFNVVFFGILQTGKDKEQAMQNMATLFKKDVEKIKPFFAGGRKVIKANIDSSTANKYLSALENIGLVIKLEPSAIEAAETKEPNDNQATNNQEEIDTSGITVAPVGTDIIENPPEIVSQKIESISDLSLAEAGVDVIENPTQKTPQQIDDISDISMAEVGSDVLENPPEVIAQKIDDISDISMAETGVDIIENPKPVEKTSIPDAGDLSLDKE